MNADFECEKLIEKNREISKYIDLAFKYLSDFYCDCLTRLPPNSSREDIFWCAVTADKIVMVETKKIARELDDHWPELSIEAYKAKLRHYTELHKRAMSDALASITRNLGAQQ